MRRIEDFARKRPAQIIGAAIVVSMGSWVGYQEQKSIHNEQRTGISLPRDYSREAIHRYWAARPFSVALRLVEVVKFLGPTAARFLLDNPRGDLKKQKDQAIQFRAALTNLGPAWIKAGQQLSIRPDLVPPTVLKELQKLCDAVDPVPADTAFGMICEELNASHVNELFHNLELVAAASLGQVYKANLTSTGEEVAIKVQRPNSLKRFSLDLYLLHLIGDMLDALSTTLTEQAPYHKNLFDAFSKGSYGELDYEKEAKNQMFFQKEFLKRKLPVKVPNVYEEYTTRRVLTSEWINGTKLADSPDEKIKELIPDGVELFLTQLLDIGLFHADPHVGNIYVTNSDGRLCLLDFGLCAEVDDKSRKAMTKAIVHLLTGNFDELVGTDSKELGFLPDEFNTDELKPLLIKVLTKGLLESGSNLHTRKRNLMEISNDLNEIFFRYPFSVPPFFALVTRGLGLLEGIALSADPEFDIFQASLPYASKRAALIMGQHGWKKASSWVQSL